VDHVHCLLLYHQFLTVMVICLFLAKKQKTTQALVFQVRNKCSCFCYRKMCNLVWHCIINVQEFHNHIFSVNISTTDKNILSLPFSQAETSMSSTRHFPSLAN
jgi:hypothetical protein